MGTSLYKKYYNNPSKQAIYTNMLCQNQSSADELSFSISGDAATISDNANTLSSVDLSGILESVSDWKTETRTIEPYQFIYVKGDYEGLAYEKHTFSPIPECLMNLDDYEYMIGLEFDLTYYQHGIAKTLMFDITGNLIDYIDVFTRVQSVLDENEIPITISQENNQIVFTSTVLGYEFYISHKLHTNALYLYTTDDCELHPMEIVMYSDNKLFVNHRKYKNGAFKGVIVVPTYPQYKADDIPESNKCLQLCHLKDRINYYYPVDLHGDVLWDRYTVEVSDSYNDVAEIDKFNKWRCFADDNIDEDKEWNEWYEIPERDRNWTKSEVKIAERPELHPGNHIMTGLYGFINWAHYNRQWTNIGKCYIVITPPDLVDEYWKNLISSFVIYNPNPFPVRLNIMTFN